MYDSSKYYTDKAGLKATLETFGVAIIPSILSPEECENMRQSMWDYLECITAKFETPILRDKPETWVQIHKLFIKHGMLIQQWMIGHCQMLWDLRQNPKIIELFSELWQTDELCTSFDGASFHLPPEITGRGFDKMHGSPSWMHSDQSPTRNGFECAQSWVSANDVNPGDATLAIYENSHKFHGEFAREFGKTDKGDWNKLLNSEEHDFFTNRGCVLRYITCPAGSVVFWDSRLIHCGVGASKTRPNPNVRCVGYVCMTPRAWATAATLKKKQKAFKELRTTNHWPHKPKLFAKLPRSYGAVLPEIADIDPPIVGDVGLRLAGY